MAHSSGLHRDPMNFSFDPVECETRRRLWAQICILDARLAEQLCREPTIAPGSYDTILPLSINDKELAEVHRNALVATQDPMNHFKTLEDIEQEQQLSSPFSSTTLMLVEAEMTRQQQQMLCFRYHPRDCQISGNSTSPQFARQVIPSGGRLGRNSWADELQERYTTRYSWGHLDSSDPMQSLVSDLCQINILKSAFSSRLAQRKETYGPTSNSHRLSEAPRYVVLTTVFSCVHFVFDDC